MILTLVCYECSPSNGYNCDSGMLYGELVTCTGVCIKVHYTEEGEAFFEVARTLKILIVFFVFFKFFRKDSANVWYHLI